MKPYLIVAASLFLALGACGDKSSKKDDDKAEKETKESAEAKTTSTASATATASASATAVAVASETAAPEAAPTMDLAEENPSAFASVEVPASVSVPTEEDYEAEVEKEITPENASEELSKIEKALDAGTP